ncbi:MAG: PadR family transcriptional regulator [Microbacteriaceae bacterium]|nr:PadR family transcriptional regulator [Microbacteriaceae bacterium]MCL2794682.1 PadR family transcriptional regulator [Microbacteriaceae bacterium]
MRFDNHHDHNHDHHEFGRRGFPGRAPHDDELHHHDPRGRGGRPGFGGFGPGGFGPSFDPADFARGGRGRRRASRGDIRAALLSLIAEEPASGYALIKRIGDKTDGLWVPSPGSVYPTLQQLVDEDLIAPSGEGRKTEYTLTDAGREHVAEHAEQLAAAWDAAPARSGADTELFESIGKLMGAIHQLRFVASEQQRKDAAAKIDELRKALYAILAEN